MLKYLKRVSREPDLHNVFNTISYGCCGSFLKFETKFSNPDRRIILTDCVFSY